ncbi:MAG: permease-like cell division protein FtsX [Candidatus Moranbacteria bacterium]|nr:permease-like cell division protein FtsX [Candidatus Moranbacteria bacterium]
MFLTISRTLKAGFQNFYRNGSLSVAAVSILTLSLLIISIIIVLTITANLGLKYIQDKIDIRVYFKSDTEESKMINFRSEILKYKEVKSADIVSKDRALSEFKANNSNKPEILKAIEAVEENPLLASVNIKAVDPEKYDVIANSIENSAYKEDIASINYQQYKLVIDRFNSTIQTIRKTGIFLFILFSLIAILITFNVIRMTIFNHGTEIEIMRLVGASNNYIRLPFVFEGIIYGTVAACIAIILLIPMVKVVTPYIIGSAYVNVVQTGFTTYFVLIFLIQLLLGTLLGVISSLLAIRRYLKI